MTEEMLFLQPWVGIDCHPPAPFPESKSGSFSCKQGLPGTLRSWKLPHNHTTVSMPGGFTASPEPDLMAQPDLCVQVLVWWTPYQQCDLYR